MDTQLVQMIGQITKEISSNKQIFDTSSQMIFHYTSQLVLIMSSVVLAFIAIAGGFSWFQLRLAKKEIREEIDKRIKEYDETMAKKLGNLEKQVQDALNKEIKSNDEKIKKELASISSHVKRLADLNFISTINLRNSDSRINMTRNEFAFAFLDHITNLSAAGFISEKVVAKRVFDEQLRKAKKCLELMVPGEIVRIADNEVLAEYFKVIQQQELSLAERAAIDEFQKEFNQRVEDAKKELK